MEQLSRSIKLENLPAQVAYENQDHLPEKIIQFGEGNFLRGFIDWMIHELNKHGLFNGKVVAIQPTPHGRVVPKLNDQDGLYTLALRGIENGQIVERNEIISSISRGINPYSNWEKVLKVAESPDIQFVFSNTTEAGLTYLQEAYDEQKSPLSFPGKVTAFLHHRYKVMNAKPDAGLIFLPCELVESNGDVLKELVLRYAKEWRMSDDFIAWVINYNQFCNTLVDRIVTGYPKDNIEHYRELLGYEDVLLTAGEPYHLFAIEAGEDVVERLPLHQAGLNVKWGAITPYRELKVRLLNGPHTMMFSVCYLAGVDTVLEAMQDPDLGEFVKGGMIEEIFPTVKMDEKEKRAFVKSVIERFENPYNKHYLADIGMNAIYKYRSRLIPSLLDYIEQTNKLPKVILFSLAALIVYYRPDRNGGDFLIGKRGNDEYTIRDNKEALTALTKAWDQFENGGADVNSLTRSVLENKELWGLDLNEIEGLNELVSSNVSSILLNGMKESVKKLAKAATK
ncbi:tagaturonate reductase [Alkalihalobacillus sp. MEB130]|uniref:tagaturonate reductase n=1 Tax=Alkalihalobacillus sp. MEB130 TaxID=2976704 RepID=UPI0028DFDA0D|nr:tagaturonate reductase [Alkalihalobacillus sp. MEB130]MDT8859777.1 tagaturonate reductase [Alkalihalobacillus sp. MEB130]